MLKGEADCRGAGGDVELGLDGGKVPIDGARAEEELLCDLGIGEARDNETQHLNLTCCQTTGGGRWPGFACGEVRVERFGTRERGTRVEGFTDESYFIQRGVGVGDCP